jgi:transcriptional regulator with XRE-family HTH domain
MRKGIFLILMIKEQLGKRLREIRHSKGLTQKALAEKTGVDYTYIGKIERAEQLPSLGVLIKVSEALSLPLDRFFMDESTLRLINLVPKEAYLTTRRKQLWELMRTLEGVHEEDIHLLTEIVKVLKRHREIKDSVPMVAEGSATYKKQKK